MDRFNALTHIPINKDFVDTRLNFDDNATNVRVLSKKKLESLDDVMFNRQQDIQELITSKDSMSNKAPLKNDIPGIKAGKDIKAINTPNARVPRRSYASPIVRSS